MKVFINAGHCIGVDSGACGNGLQEAVVAMNIAKGVSKYLLQVGYTTKVFSADSLDEIVDVSNYWGADIFIAIHANSSPNPLARGTETFSFGTARGARLASAIQNKIVEVCGTIDRGVKKSNFYVLRHTNCPAALVETAFISNEKDAELLKCEDNFARAIALGVSDFYK